MQRLMGLKWRHSHAVNFVVNLGVYTAVVLFFWLAGNHIHFGTSTFAMLRRGGRLCSEHVYPCGPHATP
jgi:hypothetical protein